MKKLVATIAILALAITSTFATTADRNIKINGEVAESTFTFDLSNENSTVSGSDYTYNDTIDLTANTTTTEFFILRSAGNENIDSVLSVTVKPSSFKGTVNGVKDVNDMGGLMSSDGAFSSSNYSSF